jgi:hypothetical protein
VSDAVGVLFEPYQIKRVAKAEAEAEKTKALATIEITEIEQRGFERLIREEGRKQENIESITYQATQQLGDDAKPENLDDDWLANFFEKCRIVSDSDMQSLWAKLLAGEATTPGSYSKRTVNFISNLDKTDAEMFTKLCTFSWQIGDFTPLIFDIDDSIYRDNGITFDLLNHLDDIGFVTFNHTTGFFRLLPGKYFTVSYYDRPISLELPTDENYELQVGMLLLTQVGQQLAPICVAKRSDEFFEYMVEKWTRENLFPRTPIPQKD